MLTTTALQYTSEVLKPQSPFTMGKITEIEIDVVSLVFHKLE